MQLALIWLAVIVEWGVFSFWWWRKNKIEHDNDDLIGASIAMGLILLIVCGIAYHLGFLSIGIVIGILISSLVVRFRFGFNFWDVSQQISPVILLLALPFLGIKGDFVRFGSYILVYLICIYVSRYYRQFLWYKSGKVGLTFIVLILVISISEVAVAIVWSQSIYFAGIAGLVLSLLLYYIRINNFKTNPWIKSKKRKTQTVR